VTVGPDVLHQRLQLVGGEADVLAADVTDPRIGDRGVHLARVRERDVIAREHEDELDH
jgi:hypothetical protein